MEYVVEARDLTEQPTAARRATLTGDDTIGAWLAEAYAEVARHLAEIGMPVTGPPYGRYAFREREMDVEAGFPVPGPIVTGDAVEASSLPGGPAAVTAHYGPYEGLEAAYKAVGAWLSEHGYAQDGAHWEIYYDNPAEEPDSSRWHTDVVVPYRRSPR
jgi:effector-binding domain-containing protein